MSNHAPVTNNESETAEERGGAAFRELATWLRALRSFFKTSNHPLPETARAEILTRDFSNEMHIARESLLSCLQLISVARSNSLTSYNEEPSRAEERGQLLNRYRHPFISDAAVHSLGELSEIIGDASNIAAALVKAPSVDFTSWSSFGKILMREFAGCEASRELLHVAEEQPAHDLHPSLLALAEKAEPDALSTDLLDIFNRLNGLLESLAVIETALKCDRPLRALLPIFTLVREGSRDVLDFIEKRTLHIENLSPEIFDALDGTAYALRMELRKTYEGELDGLVSLSAPPTIYGKVESAHGLLRDCFQQSNVALAQIFDREISGKHLYRGFQTKLEQSLVLRRDLWKLLQLARRAQKEGAQQGVNELFERLNAFRDGSLRYLMYKDWESFERFSEEVATAREASELARVLHRFEAYLETLFGQVNMRAVLSDQPFDASAEAA